MSRQPPLNLNDCIVKEYTSSKGAKFAVAYPKSAGYTAEMLEGDKAKAAVGDDSWIDVNWPQGFFASAQSGGLDQQVIERGISSVQNTTYGIVWKYELFFSNTQGWGFHFKDATNDVYAVSTIINGSHYLLYNSDNPTMIGVQ